MRINTNVASLNAQRILSKTGSEAAKSIGRLSSGFRINRAADDAAGLGIANSLRNDIRSLKQASRNAEQATALLQVAEGATSTIGNIVDRMKELAAQAASSNSGDRTGLQAEFETLRQEITRIVDTTQYQGTALLQSVAAQDAVEAVAASTHTAQALASGAGNTGDGSAAATGTYTGAGDTITLTFNGGSWSIDDGGETEDFASGETFAGVAITIADGGEDWVDGDTLTLAVTAAVEAQDAVEASGGARQFLVSSSGDYAGQDLVSMDGLNLTVDTLGIALSDISTQEGAQTALAALDGAVDEINSSLSTIGATQNRIDFALENVKTTIENFAAAESTIRDADMAEEMSTFTKQQILQQAGTAMLAQANSAPQQILRLLQ